MKKIVIAIVFAVVLIGCWVALVGKLLTSYSTVSSGGVTNGDREIDIPFISNVETITGINKSVTLRRGLIITEGSLVRHYDPESWPESTRAGMLVRTSDDGIPTEDIRIVDVYGSECTIVFVAEDDGRYYVVEDFPLSCLEYNEGIVSAADDGAKENILYLCLYYYNGIESVCMYV